VPNLVGGCTVCTTINHASGIIIKNSTTLKMECQCSKGYVFGFNEAL